MPIERLEDIPRPIRALIFNVAQVEPGYDPVALRRAVAEGHRLGPAAGTLSPSNEGDNFIFLTAGFSSVLADKSANLRALINAYGQVIANPRPDLSTLAKWQQVSPGGLRHRYTQAHVAALNEVASDDPLVDAILLPLVGVRDQDLRGITVEIDAQLDVRERMRDYCTEEFTRMFGGEADYEKVIEGRFDPLSSSQTRLIADFGLFMVNVLKTRDPKLLPMFERWVQRLKDHQKALKRSGKVDN